MKSRLAGSRRPKRFLLVTGLAAMCGFAAILSGATVGRADDAGIFSFLRDPWGWGRPDTVSRPVIHRRERIERLQRVRLDDDDPFMTPQLPYGYGAPYGGSRRDDRRRKVSGDPVRSRAVAHRTVRAPVPAPQPVLASHGLATVASAALVHSGRTMCVRTCDGYVFPLGRLARNADLPAHQAACDTACPGAETQLYTLGRGASEENPLRARSVRDGSLYRTLATALLFRTKLAPSCSCQGPNNMAAALPIAEDGTLRTGDLFVDERGRAKVFDGSTQAPHPPSSFAEFRRSRVLSGTARRQVDALMGVSQRETAERDFQRSLRTRQASLEPVAAPAGSARGVQAFRVTPSGGVTAGAFAPTIIVVR